MSSQHDDELWEELIAHSIHNPGMVGALLEHTVGNIDPLALINRVPKGMEIPRLRDRLARIISDYRTETSLREGCNNILQVGGVWWESAPQNGGLDAICDGVSQVRGVVLGAEDPPRKRVPGLVTIFAPVRQLLKRGWRLEFPRKQECRIMAVSI